MFITFRDRLASLTVNIILDTPLKSFEYPLYFAIRGYQVIPCNRRSGWSQLHPLHSRSGWCQV